MPDIRPAAAQAACFVRPRAPNVAAFLGLDEAEVAALADQLLAQASTHGDSPPPPYDVAVRLPPPYSSEASSRARRHAPRRWPRPAGAHRVAHGVLPLPALVSPVGEAAGPARPAQTQAPGARPGALPLLAGAAALYRSHRPGSVLAGLAWGMAYLVALQAVCVRARQTLRPAGHAAAAPGVIFSPASHARRDAAVAAAGCMASVAQLALHGPGPGTLLLLAALLGWLEHAAGRPLHVRAPSTLDFDALGRGRAQSPWPALLPRAHPSRLHAP